MRTTDIQFSIGGSFAHKMTLMALLASSMASVTLMFAFLAFDSVTSHTQLKDRLATLADIVGQNSTAALNFDDQQAALEVLQALRAETPIVSACLYAQSGALFAEYQREIGIHDCPQKIEKMSSALRGFTTVTRTVSQQGEVAGTLYLKSDLKEIQQRWRRLLKIAAALLILALIVGGIAGSLLQHRILKPVRELAGAMRAVTTRQDLLARVSISGNDEIAQLGTGFNIMLSELAKRDVEKSEAEARLQYQALNDDLTGLPNRRLLADRLGHALAVAERERHRVALVYIDLDGFKLVNDSLGHAVGDILLKEVAERLRSRVRQSDTLARLGGDEFSVVLCGLNAREEAGVVAADILEVLSSPFTIENHVITISASIGVSFYPDNGSNAAYLLQQADSAMYSAKRSGKSRMKYFSEELGVAARERLSLETELRTAIALGQIVVYYQPEFEIATRRLVRFEALARWIHPTLGTIPPSKFIPIAEETGIIVPLGAYIMESACRAALEWQAAGPIQVAVNVSSIQFVRDTFVDEVMEVLRHTGLPPALLQIELTESVMLTGVRWAADAMTRLSALGVGLAIDDFGTGYSCLGYLPHLPFNSLKIDRSFVNELGSRPEIDAMVHSLVMLAHNLGMRVIAEGVETERGSGISSGQADADTRVLPGNA
jgi:diguanylate cyclase (GGDEF)-like protein